LAVARGKLETWLDRRERNLLKCPAGFLLLSIIRETVLSPVAILLVKLHAPGMWKSCDSCDGFIEAHCCFISLQVYHSLWYDDDDESEEEENFCTDNSDGEAEKIFFTEYANSIKNPVPMSLIQRNLFMHKFYM